MAPTPPNTRKFARGVASAAAALACILSLLPSSSAQERDRLPGSEAGGTDPRSRQLRASSLPDPRTVEARPPPRFATAARACPVGPDDIDPSDFKSQRSEDRKVLRWLGGLCGGTYVEMGALDGVTYSNSYVFRRALGWRGVLVELLPRSYERLVVNRPDEIATVHAGVCDEPRTLHYFDGGAGPVGGIYEFTAPDYRRKFWGGAGLDHPDMHGIECDTLDGLLLKNAPGVTYFDFFSLDVEGAELAVLRSVDWERVGFGVLVVEADGRDEDKDEEVKRLVESHGYEHQPNVSRRNFFFVNRNFEDIYGEVLGNINIT